VTNLPLAILVTGSGALLAYSGIVNPAGGLVAQIGHVLRGEALATSASAPAVTVVDPSANMPGGTTYDSQIPAAARGSGAGVVAAAQTWLGVPYKFGGTTRAGVDCSGFTENVYATVGVTLPRTAALQQVSSKGHTVSYLNAAPGDLLFYGFPAYHVAIYLGGGQQIAAPHTGTVVQVQNVDTKKLTTVRRFV
jgi:cell wall-associated NlpC family hydrolase